MPKVIRDHHNLRRNLNLNDKYISNDGGDEGIRITDAGLVGIGVSDPDTALEVLSTSTQLKLSYDGSSFAKFDVDASSHLNITADESGNIRLYTDGGITFGTKAGGNIMNFATGAGSGFMTSMAGDLTLQTNATNTDINLKPERNIVLQPDDGAGEIVISSENSGDGVVQQKEDSKDLVIQQYDGDEVIRFTDGGDVKVTNVVYFAAETANTIGDGATGTIDWNVSQKQKVTITGTGITCNFTNPPGACNLLLKVVQGDGSDVIATWDGDIKWPSNDTVPTLSTGNGDIDIISFYFDGTNYFGVASLDFA